MSKAVLFISRPIRQRLGIAFQIGQYVSDAVGSSQQNGQFLVSAENPKVHLPRLFDALSAMNKDELLSSHAEALSNIE